MNKFTKPELTGLAIIFSILIAVSIPNFIVSLRRARDQARRDDLGTLVNSLDEYYIDFGEFPSASPDGRIMDCMKPGEKPFKDKKDKWIIDAIPCDWGKDSFTNLVSGKVYIPILSRDPDYQKGGKYSYFSDGNRYQIYAAMEGGDEAEIDPKIIARNLMCGERICNVGRSYNVPTDISVEMYNKLLLETNVKK